MPTYVALLRALNVGGRFYKMADLREHLSESGLDCDSLRLEAIAELQRTVGFDRWCWPLADPETLLPLSGLAEHDFGPAVPRSLELEYSGSDCAAKNFLGY